MRKDLKERIDVARGDGADVLIKNVNVVDLFSRATEKTNVALKSRYIAGIGDWYTDGSDSFDFSGMYLIPGLVDGHIHLESSFLSPRSFARAVVPHGTTACVLDPHEIANVAGIKGIEWLMESSEGLPLDLFFMAPSCVPATHLETSGAKIGVEEVAQILALDRCLGLGEVMNFPGVVGGDNEVLDKIQLALSAGKRIDGHAPGLSGADLNAYLSAGIETDHECTTRDEAAEKLRKGMKIMIREGSLAQNLTDLIPLVQRDNGQRFMFVSDDVNPESLCKEGHMDRIVRKAVRCGIEPIMALSLATLNICEHYGLRYRGAIAPGFLADLVVVRDLKEWAVEAVFKDGELVWSEGSPWDEMASVGAGRLRGSMNVSSPVDFTMPARGDRAKVIDLIPGQLITGRLVRSVRKKNGKVVADRAEDTLKLAVIERHRRTGNRGLGLVHGFGLRDGALGSSVSHDSHNVIIVGANDEDMSCALDRIVRMDGGLVVTAGQQVVAELPLPIGGLLSDRSAEDVTKRMKELHSAARGLGCGLSDPFTALSFLALPVIPELRLSDLGLVDVAAFALTPLWED